MTNLFESIKYINLHCRDVAIMFSCGKDSIVMTDLFMRYARNTVKKIIFMYYCPGLSFDEKILQYYEKRYSIKIDRIPHPDISFLLNERHRGKKLKLADMDKYIKSDMECEYIAYGFRKQESLQRRGQLSLCDKGVDFKYRKCFPLTDWIEHHVWKYIKDQKLLLPETYKSGLRDLNSFKGNSLLYIYNNCRADYDKIIKIFPDVEGELIRAMEGHGARNK